MGLVALVNHIFKGDNRGRVHRVGVYAVIGADCVARAHLPHIECGVASGCQRHGVFSFHPKPNHQGGERLTWTDFLLHHVIVSGRETLGRKNYSGSLSLRLF